MDARVMFQSSIRIESDKVMYFDPFRIRDTASDADIIFITHDHFDHYSPEDIGKVIKPGTVIVVPQAMESRVRERYGNVTPVKPFESLEICGVPVETVPAYNVGKAYHPKEKGFVGYIVTVENTRIYVMGDTDRNPDVESVKCDELFIPIGGTYTMNAAEAAAYVNAIRPRRVIPTHYGEIVGSPSDGAAFAQKVDPAIETELQLYNCERPPL